MLLPIAAVTMVVLSLGAMETNACEATEAYKEAWREHVKAAQKAYDMCTQSASEAQQWYKYSRCIAAGDDDDIGGGCGHLSGLEGDGYGSLDTSFCEALSPQSAAMADQFLSYVAKAQIEKCR